ncbi:MAG TPA: amidohydrolase family protein [Candidatus Polarisedimenticolia bacterium]|jgi:Tol biopolymer transport system component/imidazolonepropionase-like amidohydrolase|nr:amidohydrolase family protein [Candidatus Polarisedimenticolia bacterium]
MIRLRRATTWTSLLILLALCPMLAGPSRGETSAEAEPSSGAKPDAKKPPKLDVNAVPENARKVEFTTDEGTWMNVDVAPDGRTILFDLLGDLYRVGIGGGRAERITSGPAFDYAARYAPDGRMIVFCSDRGGTMNLWLANADGSSPRALTEEKDSVFSSPSWTPDGSYVLARREETTKAGIPPVEIWMYHKDGGSGVKVIAKDKIDTSAGPVASPDGRFIYLTGRKADYSYTPNMTNGLWNVFRLDRTTGELISLTTAPDGGLRPTLSPDGRHLAYARRLDARTQLYLRDLATGAERVLARQLPRDDQEAFAQMDVLPASAFTPDGKSFVYWNGGKIHRLDVATGSDSVVPFTADVSLDLRPLWRVDTPVGGSDLAVKLLRWPTLSPDGRLLAFDALGKIWMCDIGNDGKASKPRRLTKDSVREYAPEFSPDGRFIAYVTWSDAGLGHVWKIRSAGGAPQRLTRSAGHYVNPSWSPKGDRIAVVAGSGAELRAQQPEFDPYYEIRWLPSEAPAGGAEPAVVTTVSPMDTVRFHPVPAFGPDGTRIFYAEQVPPSEPGGDAKVDLVSVRLDGTDKKQHLRFVQAEDAVPSPDGAWVAYVSRDDVYVAAMPRAGKDPVEIGGEKSAVPVYRLSTEGGGYVGWADSGATVVWGMGNTIYRQRLDRLREATLKKALADKAKEKAAEDAGKKPDAEKGDGDKAMGEKEAGSDLPKPEAIPVSLVVPKPRPRGSVVLKNARAVTMKGDEVIQRADIVVQGNRIAAIGPAGSIAVPAGAAVIDLGGKTVIPGLVDVHAHLHYSSFEIFPDKKWEYVTNLAYGVTTTHDPSAHSLDVFAQAELVEAGEMIGPRIYSTGDVLYGGVTASVYAKVDSLEDALHTVRRMKTYGAHWLKVYQQPRREQRIWFIEAARQEGIGATMEGAGELHTDLTNILDGYTGLEHSLPVHLYKDVVTLVARSGTNYTPTLLVSYGGPTAEAYWYQHANPHDDERLRRFTPHEMLDGLGRRRIWYPEEDFHFPTVASGAARIARAGGRVALGAHGQLQGLGAHWEMWGFTIGNAMTPMEALRTATWSGAEALGFGKDLGSLEAGKLADLVVIDGDPLADIRQSQKVPFTMKDGVLYDASTMDEVWPEKKPLGPFFWQRP